MTSNDGSVVNVQGGWTCVVCDQKLASKEEMEAHSKSEQHAFFLSDLEARSPEYQELVFWRAVDPLLPVYPSPYPNASYHENEDVCASQPALAPPTVVSCHKPQPKTISFAPKITRDQFFDSNYKRMLPFGEYLCEPCLSHCPSLEQYYMHLSSPDHSHTLRPFKKLEVDYFQPCSYEGRVFFIGLVSNTVITDERFFESNQTALMLQWKVADRLPSNNSVMMQASPEQLQACFDL